MKDNVNDPHTHYHRASVCDASLGEEIVINCSNSAGVYASFKYKEGIFYDECYSRDAAMKPMSGWTARNGSCFKDDTDEYVDFVLSIHIWQYHSRKLAKFLQSN